MKTIQGTFQFPDGSPAINAVLYLKLSQDAVAFGTSQIAPRVITVTLDGSGQIPGGTSIYANDELTPFGTVYIASVIAPGGGLIYGPELIAIIGPSPINFNNLTPTNVGGIVISYPNPVLQNPSAAQTITGQPLTIASSVALTIQGFTLISGQLLITNTATFAGTPVPQVPSGTGLGTSLTPWLGIYVGAGGATNNVFLTANAITASRTANFPDNTGTVAETNFAQTWTAIQTFGSNTQLGALISQYNGISTVSNGVPSEYATIDLTGQNAAIGTTTLYAVPASGAGQYRFSWNAKVLTPAGSSSTLGALTVVYTDPDGVVQTIVAGALSKTGTLETTDAGNVNTTVLLGIPLTLNCKASTNITYAFAYASNAANAMLYNIHLKLEAL